MLSLIMATDVFSVRGSGGEKKPLITPGATFPDTPLPTPANKDDRTYLGLPEGRSFTIKDIKADLVLVEIMSVYCGACRRQAPVFNKLHDLIESTPETKGRIKMVSVSIGDIESDIKAFKEAFKVVSPIVPDSNFEMHVAIGSSDTPFSIFVRQVSKGKPGTVVKTHLGIEENYKHLFKEMKSLMKMDPAKMRKE
jgi:hypothetical protein